MYGRILSPGVVRGISGLKWLFVTTESLEVTTLPPKIA